MFFINFTATTATYRVNYLIIWGLSGGRRGGKRVTEVAEESHFYKKWLFFEHFLRNYEQICINFRVKIMLIQQKHAQNRSKAI